MKSNMQAIMHLIFIISTPEYNTGVVSKATDNMLHFLSHIGKKIL